MSSLFLALQSVQKESMGRAVKTHAVPSVRALTMNAITWMDHVTGAVKPVIYRLYVLKVNAEFLYFQFACQLENFYKLLHMTPPVPE